MCGLQEKEQPSADCEIQEERWPRRRTTNSSEIQRKSLRKVPDGTIKNLGLHGADESMRMKFRRVSGEGIEVVHFAVKLSKQLPNQDPRNSGPVITQPV